MSDKNLFSKLIGISPWTLGAVAMAVLMLGAYLQIGENARAAQGIAGGIAGMTTFGFLSKIACGIGFLALAKVVLSSGERGEAADDIDMLPRSDSAEEVVLESPVMPAASYVETVTRNHDVEEPAPRRSFGLRKALIFLIGGAFAVMLGSVLWDVVSGTIDEQSSAAVSVSTAQERVAQSVADTIVPDADPNRSWTDIDVTPVVEWGVAKFHMALSGDRDAQMLLGMIVGGVLFALFMLKFYFRLRRAMQPKTTAHIGGMGIN